MSNELSRGNHGPVVVTTTAGAPTAACNEYELIAAVSDAIGLEPATLEEARRQPEWSQWQEAISSELENHRRAHTWDVVDLPAGWKPIGSRFVFKLKLDAQGHVIKRKARLVAQGFTQVPGVDYLDTYAPVAKLASM